MNLLKSLGFLRISLLSLGIINVFLSPEPGTFAAREGIEVIPTLITPAAAPILMMVILFDALMSKVRASDSHGEEKRKFKHIMYTELAVAAFMIIGWLPYFLALGE
jgi:hypothetical protein